jgi:hypothetical protein
MLVRRPILREGEEKSYLHQNEEMRMNSHWLTSGVLASAILLAASPSAYALTEITCLFSWPENAEANVKAHSQRAATLKKVTTKSYEELVGKELAVRVSGKGGANCTLNHPQKTTIEIKVRKDEFRLDPAGPLPDCNALQATVKCEGMEAPGN